MKRHVKVNVGTIGDTEEPDPIVIIDDNQEAFWTTFTYGSGTLGMPTDSNETTIKKYGTNSLKIVPSAGATAKVGMYHTYGSDQDWSAKEYFCFWFYGGNSGATFTLEIRCNDFTNRYERTFKDNFTGWKRFTFNFMTFTSYGSPNWNKAKHIEIYWNLPNPGTFYMDRVTAESRRYLTIPFDSLSFRENPDLSSLDDFVLTAPRHLSEITKGDLVKIYVDNTLKFKGYYEGRDVEVGGETGDSHTIYGRSTAVLLDRRFTKRELFTTVDPGQIVKYLNTPIGDPFVPSNVIGKLLIVDGDNDVFSEFPTSWMGYGDKEDVSVYWNTARYFGRSLFKFALPADIAGATIRYAKMVVYLTRVEELNDPSPHRGNISAYRITSTWAEDTVTWNTQPTHNATETANCGTPTSTGWQILDIKADVILFAAGSAVNYGWKLKDSLEYSGTDTFNMKLNFASKHGPTVSRPYLRLVYRRGVPPYADTTASHNLDESNFAIDGDTTTGWNSNANQAVDMLWRYDLGSTISICRIDIQQDTDLYARNWQLETSTNGTDWTFLASATGDSTQPTIALQFTARDARYVRIKITAAASYYWKILEVTVYKAGSGKILTEGTISSFGQNMTVRSDFQNRREAISNLGRDIGWQSYLTFTENTNILNFKARGADLSDSIKFIENVNLKRLNLKDNISDMVNRLTVLGHGEGAWQLRGMKEDLDSEDQSGTIFEGVIDGKELMTQDALNIFLEQIFTEFKTQPIVIDADVEDVYSVNSFAPCDKVYFKESKSQTDGDYRLYLIERSYEGDGEEHTRVVAGNRMYDLATFIQHWMIKNQKLWANTSQEISARTQIEP